MRTIRKIPGAGRAALARFAAWPRAPWIVCAAFVAYAEPLLRTLQYNFDEGIYIQQALLVLAGQLPYRDFFYHQTPLYPFTLAAVGAVLPRSLLVFRGVSLVATAGTGVVVHRIATELVPRRAALAAQLLFYGVPLQFYGLLAVPLAPMLLLQTAGTYLLLFRSAPAAVRWGVVLLVLSVLFKPLSASAALAAGVCLLVLPGQRPKIGRAIRAGFATTLVAWGVFHALSRGAFTKLLLLQASRYAHKGGFDAMMQYEPFRKVALAFGATTAVGWNVQQMRLAFFLMGPVNGNFWLLVLGAAGQVVMWRAWGRRWAGWRLVVTLWWLAPLAFSLWVWEPIWDHYCLQLVPPLAVLAAVFLHRAWLPPPPRRALRVLAAVGFVAAVVFGVVGVVSRRGEPLAGVPTPHAGETWLTFDPLVNFVTRTVPACGIIDPFNVYGDHSLVAMARTPELTRYEITSDAVIRCLAERPDIRIAFGAWAPWFVDAKLRAYLETLPPDRIVGTLRLP
jgi:hypothetical protein